MTSFAQKVQNTMGELVYLVRGKDEGRPAWYYVLVDKLKLSLFLKALGPGKLPLAQYGKVLFCGFGEDPPKDIKEKIKKLYQ